MVPVAHILGFAPGETERTFGWHVSQNYTAFDAGAAEGNWTVDWALFDSPLPLIGWSAGAGPSVVPLRMLIGVGLSWLLWLAVMPWPRA